MTITIGNITFDHATYDERGDVLYLHVGERQAAADSLAAPEGHAIRYDADGEVIGLTIVNARWLLDRDGKITITIPEPHRRQRRRARAGARVARGVRPRFRPLHPWLDA